MINERGQVFVANSTLKRIARCSTEAFLSAQGWKSSDEAPPAECGQAAHEALALFLQGQDVGVALAKFDALYEARSHEFEKVHDDHRLSHANTRLILKTWMEDHPLMALPFRVNPDLVEIAFEYPLSDDCVCGHVEAQHNPGEVRADYTPCRVDGCACDEFAPAYMFWGRLDAIVHAKHDGGTYVLDHKTTASVTPWWSGAFRTDAQMSGYVWAAQRTLGRPISGVFINAIEFSKLPNSDRKCKTHGMPYAECTTSHLRSELLIYSRTEDQLEEWRKTALHLAKRYRDLVSTYTKLPHVRAIRMQGTLHGACSLCAYTEFCALARPVEMIQTMLHHDPVSSYEKSKRAEMEDAA